MDVFEGAEAATEVRAANQGAAKPNFAIEVTGMGLNRGGDGELREIAAWIGARVRVSGRPGGSPESPLTTGGKMSETPEAARHMLRHTVATLAYRGGKTIRDAPAGFGSFAAAEGTRTPVQVLAHIGDLLDWALAIAIDQPKWHASTPLSWDREVDRFFEALARFDKCLASEDRLAVPSEKLFQGPIADALSHVGQLAMLRRMAGIPMRGENYFVAEIEVGRVGSDQARPRREFD